MLSTSSRPRKAFGASSLSLAAIAVGLLVAAAPGAGAAGAVASSTPRCSTSGLDIWFEPEIGGGTAGSVFYRFQLTNLSAHRCTLTGYPKVFAATLAGQRFGSAAAHEAAGPPHTVSLAVGASASALVRVAEAGNFSPSDCHPRTAAGFRVSPPGQTASRFVPFPFEACARAGHSNLSIRAVKRE
ncbi:MAG TPA: DUF4232 domain-containing protein [Solirubrobacterales bacterium]|nr:DUF4232 domain-containing protein [Solirubrobacterales bacterium]